MNKISLISALVAVVVLNSTFAVFAGSFNLNNPCVAGSGNDYPVGPGQSSLNISDVPWNSLGPGDTVRIYHKATPYQEKIIISTSGTEKNPIRICGVAGPAGERPILDGDGATNNPDDNDAYSTYAPMQGLAMILIYNRNFTTKSNNITIDGLHIKNAKNTFSYTRTDGSSSTYENGSACIRVQAGDNIIIRDNEIENCGNGIFTMSLGYNEAQLTRNILIEGNYIHGHGQNNSFLEHGVYIQAIKATYQYNRFGPMSAGAEGTTLKERVAGSVIRYNWFDAGRSARFLDLVEVQDARTWYIVSEYMDSLNGADPDPARLELVEEAESMYRESFVYANFFNHIGSVTNAGSMVHYGWDNEIALAREGTLYFYNNTISIQADRTDTWRFRLFDMRNNFGGTPNSNETIEVFNNIFYHRNENVGANPAYLCMSNSGGTINFGVNWISSYNQNENLVNCYSDDVNNEPTLNGLDNLIDGTNAPAPLDSFMQTINTPLVTGNAQVIPTIIDTEHPVNYQYIIHQNRQSRLSVTNLGAMEIPTDAPDIIFVNSFD
ncbi:MAG: hypothetical protein L3J52_04465 [Proteobacteria bacterium]|nr:hypothetical protein [Pseudomonadota bacterium]